MADIQIYTTAICPYCLAAKQFLTSRSQTYSETRVDFDREKRQEMVTRAGRTSVPQIFINGTHVGGYDDMVALDRAGGLKPLLEAAP